MEKRMISFSPPDITEQEIAEVAKAMSSGWITTGPRVKLLERRLAAYIETGDTTIDCETEENIEKYSKRVVCLNSATAAEELNLRILGIQPGDEVIVPAYTYTASASAAVHCGAKIVFIDIQKDGDPYTHAPEMDYDKLEAAIPVLADNSLAVRRFISLNFLIASQILFLISLGSVAIFSLHSITIIKSVANYYF